jgi:hypothetical protein
MLLVAVVLPIQVLVMPRPGAKTSTILPKLENDARVSVIVDAPTVTAEGERAGEVLAASTLPFPAATLNGGYGAKESELERVGSTNGSCVDF